MKTDEIPSAERVWFKAALATGEMERPGTHIAYAPSLSVIPPEIIIQLTDNALSGRNLASCLNDAMLNNNLGLGTKVCLDRYGDIGSRLQQSKDNFNSSQTLPPPGGSPLVLDLNGDGVQTSDLLGGAYFDLNGNGFAEQTGWISANDGLLVLDRNSDGIINDGTELFGDQTILQNSQKAVDGFEALADLDGNADGVIDANDAVFSQLRVWKDIDGDSYSVPNELLTLNDLGIQSITTGYTTSSYVDPKGNEHRQTGSFTFSDSTTSTMTDVWFRTDGTYTIANEWLDVPEAIAALPDLQGYGDIYDLHQAMVRDTGGDLQGLIEDFVAETDPVTRTALMEDILFLWTGSDGIDPDSRGGLFDARQLNVLERLYGKAFVGTDMTVPVGVRASPSSCTVTGNWVLTRRVDKAVRLCYSLCINYL